MAKAPLPGKLPGVIFVLVWSRERETFILHIDDENYSSFNVGGDIADIQMHFKLWGYGDLGNRAIDMAREFGAAKASLTTGRVVALFDRGRDRQPTAKFEEEGDARGTLPSLRSHM